MNLIKLIIFKMGFNYENCNKDNKMEEILKDKTLVENLKIGIEDVKNGDYTIV